MRNKLLLLATLSLLGVFIHGLVPHRPYGSPPKSDYWSTDDKDPDRNYVIGSEDDRTSDRPSDKDIQRYRNPRVPNARLSPISPPSSTDSAPYYRIRRATNDAFPTVVEKMMKISRVINGIALQQDITNGTVKPDVVIKELLDLSQLDFGNLEEMSKVIDAIRGLSETLSKDKDQAERIEKRFQMYDFMLKSTEGLGDTVTITDKDDYKTAVETLKAANVNLNELGVQVDSLKKLFESLTTLIDTEPPLKEDEANTPFDTCKTASTKAKRMDFTSIQNALQSDVLRKDLFGSLDGVQKAMDAFFKDSRYYPAADKKPTAVLQSYMQTIESVAKDSINVMKPLKTLDRLIQNSLHPFSGDRKLDQTAGFPNGFSDVDLVPKDLIDPWVKEIVDGQVDSLAKGMNDLTVLARKARVVSESLTLAAGYSNLLKKIVGTVIELSSFQNAFEPLATDLLKIFFDTTASSVPDNKEAFGQLLSNIVSLTKKLKAMDDVLRVSTTLFTEVYSKKLDKISEITTHSMLAEIPPKLTELKKYEGAREVKELLLTIKPSFDFLFQNVSIKNELEYIETNYKEIDIFVGGLSNFLGLISAFRKKPGVDQIKPALDAVDKYRNEKQDFGSFGKLKKLLIEVNKELEDLKKSFGGMKGAKNPDSKSLVQSADVWRDSQTIGSATRVFRGIMLLSEWNEDVVNPAAKKLIQDNLVKMSPEDQKNLKQLDTLDGDLKKLKTGLTGISSDPTMSKTDSNLASFSPVYSLASKTNGLKYDFKAMSDSVERLARDLKGDKDLMDVKSKLDRLDSMGLDFAKHHTAISSVKKSLENLDKFFASLVDVVVANGGSGAGTGSGAGGAKEEKSSAVSYLPYGLIVLLVVLLIIVIVLYIRKRNQKDQKDDCKVVIPPSSFEYYVSNFFFRYRVFGALYSSVMETAAALKLFFLNLYTDDSAQPQTTFRHVHEPNEIPYRRADVPLALKGRLTLIDYKTYNFETGYIHGNVIEYPNKLKVAISQAPHLADKKLGRKENIGMYYAAAMEQQCKLMICLTPTGGDQCAQYFPTEKGAKLKFMDGKLVVTCKKVENKWDGAVVRKLNVKFDGRKSFSMDHIQYEKWTGKVLPKKREALYQILSEMENSAFPVFIHCTDGLHQSAVLAQVLMNKEMLSTKKELDYGLSLQELRNYRVDAITSGEEYLEAGILTYEYLHYNQITKNKNVVFSTTLAENVKKIKEDIAAMDAGKTDGDVIEKDKIAAYNQKINLKTPEVPPEVKEDPKPEEKKDEVEEDVSPVTEEGNAGSETMLAANDELVKAKKEEKRARRAEEREEEKRKKAEERRAKKRKDVEKLALVLVEEEKKPLLQKIKALEEENKKRANEDKPAHKRHDKNRKNVAVIRNKKDKRKKQGGRKKRRTSSGSSDQSKNSSQMNPSKPTSVLKKVDKAPLLDATQEEPAPDEAPNIEDNMKTAGE